MIKTAVVVSVLIALLTFNSNAQWNHCGSPCFAHSSENYYAKLAISGTGTPYVAYKDYLNGNKITVKAFDGTNWNTVGSAGFSNVAASPRSISIDPSGVPFVSYVDDVNKLDKVMKYNGTSWITLPSPITSNYSSIYMDNMITHDASGTLYILCINNTPSKATRPAVFKYVGSSWTTLADTLPGVNATLKAFMVTASGVPYCWYTSVLATYSDHIRYFSSGTWTKLNTTLSSSLTGIAPNNVKYIFDNSGTPHQLYTDGNNMDKTSLIKVIGTVWQLVGSAGFTPTTYAIDIAFDNGGSPYVIYASSTGSNIVKYDGAGWIPFGTTGPSLNAIKDFSISPSTTPFALFEEYCDLNWKLSVMNYDPTKTAVQDLDINGNENYIFPNPNNGDFKLHVDTDDDLNLTISDISGRMIYTQQLNKNSSSISVNLPTGVYILHAYNNNTNSIKKLIIEK
jgi:hypothetical protein